MARCVICRGARVIRLPVYRSVQAWTVEAAHDSISIDDASRIFPCPECAEEVPMEKVAIVEVHSRVSVLHAVRYAGHPGFMEDVKETAAAMLVDELRKSGFISFQRGPDERDDTFAMIATIGVVSPNTVTKLEERIAARQNDVARDVVEKTIAEVMNWGSHYTGGEGHISKSLTCDFLREKLTAILRDRKERTAA